jgi:hypothetical protein
VTKKKAPPTPVPTVPATEMADMLCLKRGDYAEVLAQIVVNDPQKHGKTTTDFIPVAVLKTEIQQVIPLYEGKAFELIFKNGAQRLCKGSPTWYD